MIAWPWSKPETPEDLEAAKKAAESRKAAHAELAAALSSVIADATDAINDHIGGRER